MAEHVMTSEAATKMLADCFRMAGADCDGNEDWRIAPCALQAVTDLRRDYGEACDEAHDLRTKVAELEQQMQGLRARCEGLAERWVAPDPDWQFSRDERYARGECANELRALVRGEGEADGSG